VAVVLEKRHNKQITHITKITHHTETKHNTQLTQCK
jgi:hypothetical protein